jgi:hypothetical protein
MAKLYPRLLDPTTKSAGERSLYEALARQLSDDWTVFHSIQRLKDKRGQPREGEADFILAHPQHGILVVEVKGGQITFDEAAQHFFSRDAHGENHDIGNPFRQAADNKGWLIEFLRDKPSWPHTRVVIGYAVAFPDTVFLDDWAWQGLTRAVLLDHNDLLALERRIRSSLDFWRGTDTSPGREGVKVLEKLLGQSPHIRNPLLLEHVRADRQQILELTEDQYEVLTGLEMNPRAIIRGCAGSGKTMLAVEKARRLVEEEGLKVLYVCFNEALSTYIGKTLGHVKEFNVFSYYWLVKYWGAKAGVTVPDYHTPEIGQSFYESTLPDLLLEIVEKIGPQYDAVIVDELQDFNQKWWDSLFWCLRDSTGGIFYAFGDEHQRIFPPPQTQPAFTNAPGFVEYILSSNCRNTQAIAQILNRFYQEHRLPKSKGPTGLPVEVRVYKDFKGQCDHLRQVLHHLTTKEQLSNADIAVLTVRRSRKTDANLPGPPSELGDLQLGNFHLSGKPPETPTHILSKSIYSFKGLERPVIILAEIDDQIPEAHLSPLLYTAMSRAKSHLILLVSETANTDLGTKFQ